MMQAIQPIGQAIESSFFRLEKGLGNDAASVFYILLSIAGYFVQIVLGKVYASDADPVQLQYWKGVGFIIISAIISAVKKVPLYIEDRTVRNQLLIRNFIGVVENLALFVLVTKIPISDINVLQTLQPFFIGFFDHLILGSQYSKQEILLSITSACGVLIIIKPDMFSFDEVIEESTGNYVTGVERSLWIMGFIFLLLIWSWSVVLVKKLNHINSTTVNFPYGVFLCVLGGLHQPLTGYSPDLEIPFIIKIFIIFGIFGFIIQITFVRAFQIGKPGKIGILTNLFVVLGFGYEILLLNEYPRMAKILGALLVVGSSIKLTTAKSSS